MPKILTLEIKERVFRRGTHSIRPEPILEVDHDKTGFIYEIRVHSEYFEAFVPVSESWLDNNFPASLATILESVAIASMEANSAPKEYENDDLSPPPSAA